MQKVYIVSAKRTAIGSFLGSLKDTHASDLGAALVKDIMEDVAAPVDEVIIGNVLSAGLGMGIARQVSIKGGLCERVPAHSVNNVCCSGMKSVMHAYNAIRAGQAGLILAGGVENMSQAPFILPKVRMGQKLGHFEAQDHILHDSLTDAFNGYHMGITAENVAKKHGITRESQDAFALESQRRAIVAIDEGRMVSQIVPLNVKVGRDEKVFDVDEYPNRGTNLERMQKLRPVFDKEGTVTAGNASGINDGASMTLIAGEAACEKHGLTPLAEIVAIAQHGLSPEIMGLGPVGAVSAALAKANMQLSDMELIELNEAFAAQALGVVHELSSEHNMPKDDILTRSNVNGGAIALGHPLGSSGNRIIVTLLHELIRQNKQYGLASLCAGGGMGTAIVIRAC